MADQTLTLTYSATGRRRVTQSGLTDVMGNAMARFLTRQGIHYPKGSTVAFLRDESALDSADKRAAIVTAFNAMFDQDPNPQHATDNFTLVLTAA